MPSQTISTDLLRQDLPAVVLGAWFLLAGVVSCGIALLRRRAQSRVLNWFGLFIGMYGVRLLAESAIALQVADAAGPCAAVVRIVDYLLIIPGILFWVELSLGWIRRFFLTLSLTACAIAITGAFFHLFGIRDLILLQINLGMTVGSMLALSLILLFPKFTRDRTLLQTRTLRFLLPLLVVMAIVVNLLWLWGVPPPRYLEPVSFVAWVFALGYEAASRTFANERRLIEIDTELETAQRMQTAILPAQTPALPGLRIAATYVPMSAVAGDFYQFVRLDEHRIGILIADVTGHGVPAALIASMIKIAMQSVVAIASNPAQVMARLNQILTPELGGSLTSAGYLLIDISSRTAQYSAAGHPPLLHWRSGPATLERIESNGLIFGVLPDCTYPVAALNLAPGDRLLLYTDGLTEPENRSEEPFGERRLEEILRANQEVDAPALSERILASLRKWIEGFGSQRDDITLIVADVAGKTMQVLTR